MGDKVLIIGGGGREHAIAWKLAQSNHVGRILVAPGNAGTLGLQSNTEVENVSSTSLNPNVNESVVKYCLDNNVDFVIVGPEAPLANGVVDSLTQRNIPCFGPTQAAARIESSKQFAKEFMQRHNIPTARWQAFTKADEACRHIETASYDALVIKASGLASGKGVVVADNGEEAKKAVRQMLQDRIFGNAGSTVVIEERLQGEEVSVLCFTDGKTVAVMPPAQDHKCLLDGDKGPNTGGMGAYAPCPQVSLDLKENVTRDVLQKTVDGLREEGCQFVGVLFAGLMLTDDGPKVLEFNCRFGDPETQVILPLLKSDLYATLMECVNGDLSLSIPVWYQDMFTVGVVAASGGYPNSVKKGHVICGLENVKNKENIEVFHAGTSVKKKAGTEETVVTSGGRVMAIVGLAQQLQNAQKRAYEGVKEISFDSIQYRTDIAAKALRPRGFTYSDAGVNIDAGNILVNAIKPLAKATARTGCTGELGGFGGFFDLKSTRYKDPLLVSGTDGVGTKLKIAQAVGQHSAVGIDLVAMCVNDILAHGAEPLFFLDYFATSKLDVGVAKAVIGGIAQGCSTAGCALLGGETAEMPGMYSFGDYDIAGFAVGAVERHMVLPQSQSIVAGDVVVGLASSGIHSNGFSLVRKIVDNSGLSYRSPCPFTTTEGLQSVSLLGESLLVPTRIYCSAVLPLMRDGKVKGFAHITGGGLVENIPRVLPHGVGVILDASVWSMPPVFGWLFGQGNIPTEEMARTFNCGIGAVLIVSKTDAASVMDHLKGTEENAWIIGEVCQCDEKDNLVNIRNLEEVLCDSASKADITGQKMPGNANGLVKRVKLSGEENCSQKKSQQMKVGVLISGSGTNLQALIDQSLRGDSCAKIVLVISNVPGVQGLVRAETAFIPTKVIKHKDFKRRLEFDMAVHAALEEAGVELVCLAGFMRIVTGEFVRKWRGRLLNIHPSLLPSFKGMNAHKLVLESGVCITGCTVHFVEEEVDAGAIVTQEAVSVVQGDTVETLQERVKGAEHRAYPRAMELLASGRIQLNEQGKVQWLW